MGEDTRAQNRFLSYWLPLITWICGIFLVSSLPSNDSSQFKLGEPSLHIHIIAFFVLFLLFYRLFQSNNKKALLGGIILSSFAFTLIISISKECWQLFIPGRCFSLEDIMVDGGAAFLAMLVVAVADS